VADESNAEGGDEDDDSDSAEDCPIVLSQKQAKNAAKLKIFFTHILLYHNAS